MFPWWKLLVTQENDGDGLGESFYFHLKTRKASENLCHKQTIQGLCDNNPRHSARPKTTETATDRYQRLPDIWRTKEAPLPLLASWQIVPSSEVSTAWRATGSGRRTGRIREGLGSPHATSDCCVGCCYMNWKTLSKLTEEWNLILCSLA